MVLVPPGGCREWVREVSTREGREVDGEDDDGVDGPAIDSLLSAS